MWTYSWLLSECQAVSFYVSGLGDQKRQIFITKIIPTSKPSKKQKMSVYFCSYFNISSIGNNGFCIVLFTRRLCNPSWNQQKIIKYIRLLLNLFRLDKVVEFLQINLQVTSIVKPFNSSEVGGVIPSILNSQTLI